MAVTVTNEYGIQESIDILEAIQAGKRVVVRIRQEGFSIDILLEEGFTIFGKLKKGYQGAGIAWKNELPDTTDQELGELETMFDEILGNPNYGDMAGGVIKILRGFLREKVRQKEIINKLKKENQALKGRLVNKK